MLQVLISAGNFTETLRKLAGCYQYSKFEWPHGPDCEAIECLTYFRQALDLPQPASFAALYDDEPLTRLLFPALVSAVVVIIDKGRPLSTLSITAVTDRSL